VTLDLVETGRARLAVERTERDTPQRIRAAAADFESLFLTQLFRTMRRTVPRTKLFGGGFGEEVYRDLLDAQYARTLAHTGGTGIGEMVARELGGEEAARALPEPHIPAGPSLGWPVHGRVTSRFGLRRDPLSGETSFHPGIDLAVPEGTPVHAVASGRVVESGWRGGYGKVVVVDHGQGYSSLYAHNRELLVSCGAWVDGGFPLALSGSTGRSTGPHVHFEVRRGGVPVDPRALVGGGG
jgi:murein DD-endopeptidase MepM/ murein hydrolase activator NlpD